ncbi:MAG TPA: T9SS type A sorting domain-containing protein [Flavobacterium sp.]
MKKITLWGILVFGGAVSAQNAPITFEPGGAGSAWTWTTFENPSTPAPPLLLVSNPSPTGMNTSATVAKLTPLVGSPPYAGVESAHGSDIGTFTLTAANAVVKIMVYKSVMSDVGIKFATADGASTGEIKVANTLVNQWEQLTFDFSGIIGIPTSTNIDQIIIFPDFQTRTTDNVCYFDNITFSASTTPPSVPMTAAPTPTRPASEVISMFSNAYTNVPVNTWHTDWSNATLTDIQIAGNDTKRYAALDFVGIETVGANLINATGMNYFHVDAWTPNMTLFRIKLVDFGANGVYDGTPGDDDVEHELTFTPAWNQWNSYDIPLTAFTGLITRGHIAQLIFSGNPAGSSTLYVDNVYFASQALGVSSNNRTAFKMFPNPAHDYVMISGESEIERVAFYNVLGQEVLTANPAAQSAEISTSSLESGVYIVRITAGGNTSSQKIVIK